MKKKITLLFILIFSQSKAQDYLNLQTFKLDNGLTVYLLPDKNATTTFGAVAVNAGAKNDPADATGLAHYLEHLLFKGTTMMGTADYQMEKPFLDSITVYYQQLGKSKDEIEREKLKSLINIQAIQASKYGLPTEFHTLLSSIGGTQINAFTQADMTVYHNVFPGEQMEKWLDLYAERFTNPVFRSFQSELEVVYEEKNRSSDSFVMQLFEQLNKNLYPTHPYGTQTTIGTSEHLKNPPIDRIYQFFDAYYVANNMALFLVGNFNTETAKPLIKEKFGKLKTGVVPNFKPIAPFQFTKDVESNIRITPVKVSVIGFKSIPNANDDEIHLDICNNLLSNQSETGLLDKLTQDGKVLVAQSMPFHYHDDGAEIIFVVPKIIGQSFNKAERLVFSELAKLQSGDFSDEFLLQVKNEMIRKFKNEMETPESRGMKLLNVFNASKEWNYITSYPEKVNKISKTEIMRIATKYYTNFHYTMHSKMGFPKKDKIEKPGFKPVITQQNSKSIYAKKFEEIRNQTMEPKFLDFKNDPIILDLGSNNKLYAIKNPYNDIATLKIKYYVGKEKIPCLDLAAEILKESSVKEVRIEDFKKQLAALNCNVSFVADNNFFTIEINGDEKNITTALSIINNLLKNPEPNFSAKKNLEQFVKLNQKEEKKNAATMGNILLNYAMFGNNSEYIKRPSFSVIKDLEAIDFLKLIKEAISYSASFHYCGNLDFESVAKDIKNNFALADKGNPEIIYLEPKTIKNTTIYFVNDKKSRQNQVYFSVLGDTYNVEDDAKLSLLSQYIGGSFSGLILQEIREYRSLAYSAGGKFKKPTSMNKPLHFISFVGCQADKTNESIDVMIKLLADLPKYPERLLPFKNYVSGSTSANYPTPRNHTELIEELQLKGFTSDPKINEYNTVNNISFDDMYSYYQKNIKDKPILITIYGDKSKIDFEKLKTLGEVIEVKKEKIATY
jgi:zinc protease